MVKIIKQTKINCNSTICLRPISIRTLFQKSKIYGYRYICSYTDKIYANQNSNWHPTDHISQIYSFDIYVTATSDGNPHRGAINECDRFVLAQSTTASSRYRSSIWPSAIVRVVYCIASIHRRRWLSTKYEKSNHSCQNIKQVIQISCQSVQFFLG